MMVFRRLVQETKSFRQPSALLIHRHDFLLKRSLAVQRPPRSSSFQPTSHNRPETHPSALDSDAYNLTRLSFSAPAHLRRQAHEMYAQCKLSSREPTTRFAIARQMRNLDLPPHQALWQRINATDELALYRWIDEAFGQLLYQKGLWKPSSDWGPEDDVAEAQLRVENLELLRRAYEEQIVGPLKERFGDSEVTIALSGLKDDQQLYCEPAVIWQSVNRESGETTVEWMSEYTADVAWPGLVSCRPDYQLARRHWEAEARQFAQLVGGIAKGMGEDGEMLPAATEEEKSKVMACSPNQATDQPETPNHASSRARFAAEAVLIRKFLGEKRGSS